MEVWQLFEMLQPVAGDLGLIEIQGVESRQTLQVCEPRVGDLRVMSSIFHLGTGGVNGKSLARRLDDGFAEERFNVGNAVFIHGIEGKEIDENRDRRPGLYFYL